MLTQRVSVVNTKFKFLCYIYVTKILDKQHKSCYNAFEVINLFADKLKKLRIEADMSRSELALRLGMSVSSISNYENNIRKPENDEIWIKLANIFNVTVDYLMDVDDSENIMHPQFTLKALNYNGSSNPKKNELIELISNNNIPDDKLSLIKSIVESYIKK